MKRFFLTILALLMPWVVLLIEDNFAGALMALILQLTVIGWIPAAFWALQVLRNKRKKGSNETVYDELD